MTLSQNSELRVFKSGILQKSSTVDSLPTTHSIGPPMTIRSKIASCFQIFEEIET